MSEKGMRKRGMMWLVVGGQLTNVKAKDRAEERGR